MKQRIFHEIIQLVIICVSVKLRITLEIKIEKKINNTAYLNNERKM